MKALQFSLMILSLLLLERCSASRQQAGNEMFTFTHVDVVAEYNANDASPVITQPVLRIELEPEFVQTFLV